MNLITIILIVLGIMFFSLGIYIEINKDKDLIQIGKHITFERKNK